MEEPDRSKRRWLQFSLGSLLFLILCVAGALTGYKRGYQAGQATRANSTIITCVYSCKELIEPGYSLPSQRRALENIIDLITSTVAFDTWQPSGEGEVALFETNQSLVVSTTGDVHREVRVLLDQLKRMATDHRAKSASQYAQERVLPSLRSLTNRRAESETHPLASFPHEAEQDVTVAGKHFDKAVQGVTAHWGEPDLRSHCTEEQFPDWCRASSIACWQRGNGFAYLAIQDKDPKTLEVVAG